MNALRRMAMVGAAVAAMGCGSDDPTGPQASEIRLNLVTISLQQLDSTQLIPSVVDAAGTLISGVPITFEATDPALLAVSSVGVVRSVGPAGSSSIKVRGAGLTRTVPVTVAAVADSLAVSPNPGVMPQKGTLQIDARLIDRAGAVIPQATIQYVVSDAAVITASASGLVTSVGPAGNASVTVSSGDFTVLVPIGITQVPTRLVVSPTDPRIAQGRTLRLGATVLDAVDVAIPAVTFQYSSLTPALVSVDQDGLVTSIGPLGNAKVRVLAAGTPLSVDVPITVSTFSSPRGDSVEIINAALTYAVDFLDSETLVGASYASDGLLFDLRHSSASPLPAPAAWGVVVARTRRKAYFTGGGGLVELDLTTKAVRSVAISGQLFDVVLSSDEQTAYVGADFAGIYVVDVNSMTVTRQLGAPGGSLHLALAPSGTKIYGASGGQIGETDIASGATTVINSAGVGVQALAVASDGRTLYGVSEGGAYVAIDLGSQLVRTTSTSGCGGWGMALSPDDNMMVISCPQSGRVAVYDAKTGALVRAFDGIFEGRRVSMSADGSVAAVGVGNGVALVR